MSDQPLCPRDARALLALYGYRDHETLEVKASLGMLCAAAGCSDTTWQSRAVPALVNARLVTTRVESSGHYKVTRYRLTPLGVQVAKTTPPPCEETTPRGRTGVVPGSSAGSSLISLSSGSRSKKEEEEPTKETTPHGEAGSSPGVVPGSSGGVVSESLLAQALAMVADRDRTITALLAHFGVSMERCGCGELKVPHKKRDGTSFLSCPKWQTCEHCKKKPSPAVESARKASSAAQETAARLRRLA